MLRRLATVFLGIYGMSSGLAVAQDNSIIGTPAGFASPFAVTKCAFDSSVYRGSYNLVNRTKHQMLTARVALRVYDGEKTLIGQSVVDLPINTPVDPGDAAVYPMVFPSYESQMHLSEPPSAIAKIECKPFAATFSGNRRWDHNVPWPEKLLPLSSASAANSAPTVAESQESTVQPRLAPVSITVTNSWNDVVENVLFVHDTVAITGISGESLLRPQNLMLTMIGPDGTKRAYVGLGQQSLSYQKFNPATQQFALANEVDPNQDFGRLGQIVVPAGKTVTTTVTFLVKDATLHPTDNRDVKYRS